MNDIINDKDDNSNNQMIIIRIAITMLKTKHQ